MTANCGAFCSFCGRCGRKVSEEFKATVPKGVLPPGVVRAGQQPAEPADKAADRPRAGAR